MALHKTYLLQKGYSPRKISKMYSNTQEFVEPPWDVDLLLDLVRFNTWHKTCIDVKSEDAVRHGIKYYKDGIVSNAADANKTKIKDFFEKPNSEGMNMYGVCVALLQDLQRSNANMAVEVVRTLKSLYDVNSPIVEIKHVDVTRIKPHKYAFVSPLDPKYTPIFKYVSAYDDDKDKYFKAFGAVDANGNPLIYDKYTGERIGKENPLEPNEDGTLNLDRVATELIYKVIYEPNGGDDSYPYFPYYGLNPIIPMILATVGFRNAAMFNIKFFKQTIKNLIMLKGRLSPASEKKFNDYMEVCMTDPEMLPDLYAHTDDPDGGIEVKQLIDRALEASFLQYSSMNRDEIIAGHKVPANRVYTPEAGKLSGNIAETSNEVYKDTTLAPLQRMLDEELINPFIIKMGLGISDWTIKFNRLGTIDHRFLLDEVRSLVDRGIITLGESANILGIESEMDDETRNMRIILSSYMPLKLMQHQTLQDRIPSDSGAIMNPAQLNPPVKGK
ncbi:hypothetical protein M0R01_03720 [bacterium]|nr:hypothetical protein [bacterium]